MPPPEPFAVNTPAPPTPPPTLSGRVIQGAHHGTQTLNTLTTRARLGATTWGKRLTPVATVGHYPATLPAPQWVPAVAVFPVYKLGGQRAFRDVGELATQALATRLSQTLRQTQVVGPVQWSSAPAAATVDDALAALETDWRRYGQPSPVTAKALSQAITPVFSPTAIGQPVSPRLVLVDVELDLSDPYHPSDLKSRLRFYLQDSLPQTASYRLRGRIWGVDPGPAQPVVLGEFDVWVPVNGDNVNSMTASVSTLEGTAQVFRQAVDGLARQAVDKLPADWLITPPSSPALPTAFPPPTMEPPLKY